MNKEHAHEEQQPSLGQVSRLKIMETMKLWSRIFKTKVSRDRNGFTILYPQECTAN